MSTLKFKTVIDERRTLSLTLPATTRPGMADVIVMLKDDAPWEPVASPSDEVFDALMRFGDGRRLGGLSIRKMAAEGRK